MKIAVVTGSNQGIGKAIASKLFHAGCTTILACRDLKKAEVAAAEITESSPTTDIVVMQCDISSSASIREFSESLKTRFSHIDILVNNAAVAFKSKDHTPFINQAKPTVDVNYFGTLSLTLQLMPLLKKSASPRIVNVASQAGNLKILKNADKRAEFESPSLTLERLNVLMKDFVVDVENGCHLSNGWPNTCYGTSKLGVIALSKLLARDNPYMMINSCCPGYCATQMSSYGGHGTKEAADMVGFRSSEVGARTPAMLALLPDNVRVTGKFFYNEKEIAW